MDLLFFNSVDLHTQTYDDASNSRNDATSSYPIEMRVERVLAGVLLAALRADNVRVLIAEMNVFNVPLQGHFMKI